MSIKLSVLNSCIWNLVIIYYASCLDVAKGCMNWALSETRTHSYWLIGQVGRVLTNRPGDLRSIPCRVIPKTLKMILDTPLLNTQKYKVHIKGKVEQSRERCCNYWKGSLKVALDYGRQLYFYLRTGVPYLKSFNCVKINDWNICVTTKQATWPD